jgi:DNA-directed RNA polymerase alpha subunit
MKCPQCGYAFPETDRDSEIFARYLAGGVTLADLGRAYGLTRSRIHTIIFHAMEQTDKEAADRLAFQQANSVEDLPIDAIGLPVRALNCLKNEDIETVGEAMAQTDAHLLRSPNFGRQSLTDLRLCIDAARREFARRKSAP